MFFFSFFNRGFTSISLCMVTWVIFPCLVAIRKDTGNPCLITWLESWIGSNFNHIKEVSFVAHVTLLGFKHIRICFEHLDGVSLKEAVE